MTRIKYSKGKTYNTGNYQSMRLDVGIEADIEGPTKENFMNMVENVDQLLKTLERKEGLK